MLPASQHSDSGRAVSEPGFLARSSVPSGENPNGCVFFLAHVAMERAETEDAVLHRSQAENR